MKTFKFKHPNSGKLNKKIILSLLLLFGTTLSFSKNLSLYNVIRLVASSGSYSDETILRLNSAATYDFDSNWDAYKLFNSGNTPNFYSVLNSIKYSINSVPDTIQEFTLPLKLSVAFSGNYTITASALDSTNFNNNYTVILEDRNTNNNIDLWTTHSYDFSIQQGDTTSRFFLHIKTKAAPTNSNPEPTLNDNLTTGIYNANNINDYVNFRQKINEIEIEIKNNSIPNVTIFCYNTNGEVIIKPTLLSNNSDKILLTLPENKMAMYIITLISDKNYYSKKFVVP